MVFLRLTRNSSICSNSVSLAWAGSHTSIWTTVVICPETQWQHVNGCYRPYLLQEGNTSLPPFCYLIQPARVRALPWAVCVSAPQKHQGPNVIFGGSFCTAAASSGGGGPPCIYFSPIRGRASLWPCCWHLGALVSIRVTAGVQLLQSELCPRPSRKSPPCSPPPPPLPELGVCCVQAGGGGQVGHL